MVLGGVAQVNKAEALILDGRNWEAFRATTEAMRWSEKDRVHGVAAAALNRLGRLEEAVREADLAIRGGDWAPHVRFLLTDSLNRLAAQHEAEGRLGKARELYLRSWRELPDPHENPMAAKALQRLGW